MSVIAVGRKPNVCRFLLERAVILACVHMAGFLIGFLQVIECRTETTDRESIAVAVTITRRDASLYSE